MKHFLTISDFTKDELLEILDIAIEVKNETKEGKYIHRMKDKSLAMIFEKSSTRTRVSFEVGMTQLKRRAFTRYRKSYQQYGRYGYDTNIQTR